MKLTRRKFLAWASISAVGAVACDAFGDDLKVQSPVLQPEDLVKGQDNWYATLCRHCPSSEGVLVRVIEGRAKKVQGNPNYPTNAGKQSARCDAGLQALYHPDRLSGPLLRINGTLQPVSWDVALDTLQNQLRSNGEGLTMVTSPINGPVGTITDKFCNAFNGRRLNFEPLSNATLLETMEAVFGQDSIPDFDIGNTDYLLSFGADFLSTWVSPTRWSSGFGDLRDPSIGKGRGTITQIDSRFSMTAANADRWIPITPGMEGYLALSLANVIANEGLHASGVDLGSLFGEESGNYLPEFDPDVIGPQIGLPDGILQGKSAAEFIRHLARDFAGHRPSLAIGGGSAEAHDNGSFNMQAIYALNHLVGSVGSTGGLRFNPESALPEWVTNQKDASIQDWRGLVDDIQQGRTKTLIVHQVDPVFGLPTSIGLKQAIEATEVFSVSFTSFIDETSSLADLILPDRVYLEEWGADIPSPGPGYQVIGFQQPIVNPMSDVDPRSFGDILLSIAQELGKDEQLPWNSVQQAVKEGADKLYSLNRGSISANTEREFWTNLLQKGGWWDENQTGPSISAPNGIFTSIKSKVALPPDLGNGQFYLIPFAHHTLLDGRNSHLPWGQSTPDPITTVTWQTWIEMNTNRANELGLREGDVVKIETNGRSVQALLYPNPALPPNVVSVPIGQGHQVGSTYAANGDDRENSNILSILDGTRTNGADALAWAANHVRVTATGESLKISKFEGEFGAREIGNEILNNPGEEVIKTVTPGSH